MKLLNITVRNIVGLVVIIALAAAMFWLIRGRFQSQLAAQASTPIPSVTHTLLPTATPSPTVTNTPVLATFTPSLTPPPLVNFDTPAPGPTYTPTPEVVEAAVASPAIKVTDRKILPLNQLRPLSSMVNEDVTTSSLFEAVGWTEQGEIVLQERNSIKLEDGSYSPNTVYEIIGTWAVSPKNGNIRSLSTWIPSGPVIITGAILEFVQNPSQIWVIHGYDNTRRISIDWSTIPGWTPVQQQLASEWSTKKPVAFGNPQDWMAAPDGETVILHIRKDKIYILKPDQPEPVILPKDKGEINAFITALTAQLSPDGQKVAYGVRFDNPDINDGYGRETDTYEIQISNLDGTDTIVIPLPYEYKYPFRISWSPDSKFIAFSAQPERFMPTHLYIATVDGSIVTDITPTEFDAGGPLYWSNNGQKLLYFSGNPDNLSSIGYWIAFFSK